MPAEALRRAGAALGRALAVLAVAVAVTGLAVLALGGDPGKALSALHLGSIARPQSVTETLLRATPLLLCGLGVAVAFRCGLWNIGAEGQCLVGMLGASLAATHLPPLPLPFGPLACAAAGAACGAAWAGLAALLRLRRGVSEVISTIMLNFLAVYLIEYLVRGPLRDPRSMDEVGRAIPEWARFPRLGRALGVGEVGGGTLLLPDGRPALAFGLDAAYLHAGVLLALATGAALWFWLARSGEGFRITATGANAAAARAAGIPVGRTMLVAFLVSGALAGLAGAVEQLAVVSRLHRYAAGEPGYGFSGIAVALLGGLTAPGAGAAALFFGALRAGCDQMQRSAGVSFHVAYVIQAVLVLLLLTVPRLRRRAAGGGSGPAGPAEEERPPPRGDAVTPGP